MARNFVGVSPGLSVSGEQIGAKWLSVESAGFDGRLAPTDDTVQKCLQKIDDFTILTAEDVQDIIGALLVDSTSINYTYTDSSNTLTIAVLPAGVDHNSLLNYSANQHIDHSLVSISPGTGLSGGGTLEATRTLSLANTAVTPGTYNNSATQTQSFTVDAQGRITGTGVATTITPAWSSITSKPTTLEGYGIAGTEYASSLGLTKTLTSPVAGTAYEVDSWSKTSYRAAKYVISATQGTVYHTYEVLVFNDWNGTSGNGQLTVYAAFSTDEASELTFTVVNSTGNTQLLASTPVATTNLVLKMHRIIITL